MKIDLGYNAGISVYNNFRNETILDIENNNLLPNVLIQVEPLVQNLSKDDIYELILQLNNLYEDEFAITLKEI